MDTLREQVRRLAARLEDSCGAAPETRQAGQTDPKRRSALICATAAYRLKCALSSAVETQAGGHPRRKHIDAPVAEFFLRMLYELQDQVQKNTQFRVHRSPGGCNARSDGSHIDKAVYAVLTKLPSVITTPTRYSLHQFEAGYLDSVDHRTTVIVLGDARNNYNDPAWRCLRDWYSFAQN